MRKVSIEKALKKIVEVMNGLKISTLKSITEEIIESKNEFIEIEGVKIRTPRPNLIMASIITFLRTRGIDVYVVTASNKISADIICWKYFGIASVKVFGSETNNRNGKIYFSKNRIIPFAEGKVKTLKEKIKGKPIVTGGDGIWDKYLLDYTEMNGIRFWVGQDEVEYRHLKEEYYMESTFIKV